VDAIIPTHAQVNANACVLWAGITDACHQQAEPHQKIFTPLPATVAQILLQQA
jgi:hypothetical protein